MNSRFCRGAIAAIFSTTIVIAAAAALADWSHDTLQNDPIAEGANNQYFTRIVADGVGGFVVAYMDDAGGSSNIRVQRVDAGGNLLWGPSGVLGHQNYGFLALFEMIADGAGGVFLVIQDSDDGLYYHPYVQHVSGAGTAWGSQGIPAVPTVAADQIDLAIGLDGSGGVVVAFGDNRNGNLDIYGQRFDANGNRQWTGTGKSLCTATNTQQSPAIASGGSGGFYLAWEDRRDTGLYYIDIYTNSYDMAGNPLWAVNGVPTCVTTDAQRAPKIITDALGGVIVAWYDARNIFTTGNDIYAQRYLPAGNALWGVNGRVFCNQLDAQIQVEMVSDGAGGAYLAWRDDRADSFTGSTVYVQAISADGLARWTSGGVPAGGGNGHQVGHHLALTSEGNVAVVWQDQRSGGYDIYAQMFGYDGGRLCNYYGQAVSTAPFGQDSPRVAADARGGFTVVFNDYRNYLEADVYMQRVDRSGMPGDPAATITRLIDHPLDQGGRMLLDWSSSWLDEYQGPGIYRYSVWRRFPGGSAPADLAPLSTDKGLSENDLIALQQAGWNYVDQMTPQLFAEYGLVVPTFADSTGAGAPVTEYMVLTESYAGNIESNVVGGWSVDNLAPGAPLALSAQLVGADANLAWTPSGYHDEDLQQYRIYRSPTPGVVPGPSNLLTSSPDTTAVDPSLPGGPWYYVVTAIDVHGNEGEPSNEVMVLSASSVDDGGLPRLAAIRGAYPNPFNPTTTIRFGVPATGHARLTVYDLRGQKVATLVDRVLTGGYHTAAWNGQSTDGRQVPSGVYLARLETAGTQATSKLVLAK